MHFFYYNNPKITDLKEQCRLYMAEQGLSFDGQLIADGKIHRYSADAKKNKPDEWYLAYEGFTSYGSPYLYCIFGSWSEGSKYEYKFFDQENRLNETEKNELKQILQRRRLDADQAIKETHNNTAKKAQQLWAEYL